MNYMRAYAGILIIISLLLLVGTVGALQPDSITFSSNPEWVIANGIDQSTITVTIKNQSQDLVLSSSTVNFNVTDSSLGTMNPISVTTNSNGEATRNFNVKTKSGNATITVAVTNGTDTSTFTIYQNIDHDTPYYDLSISPPLFTYPEQGPVNRTVPFKVSIYDKLGNPVDNRNPKYAHNVSLHVNSALIPDDCYFNVTGNMQDISIPLDSNGILSVDVKLTTKSGTNKILMDNFEGKISTQIAWITAMAAGDPYSITGSISDEGILTANDVDKFTIDYYLYDEYGNPMENQSIWVNTTPFNEQKIYTSNSLGLIRLYYGPMTTASETTLTATPLLNSSIMNTTVAHFVNSGPTNMVLAVTPQTMASLDVLTTEHAFVRATVIDYFGNPVPNESVSFSLGTVSSDGFTQTAQPALSSTTAITDNTGNAIVLFYPGSFAKQGEPGYNRTATGEVVITALWNEIPRSVKATWKNYAYLSIIPSAEPPTVKLNETIDITIDVIGNGYNLPGGNVAAIVDLDSGSSIWSNKDVPGPKRVDSAKEAAKAFAIAMLTPEPTNNWIGVNSFGNERNDDDRLLSPQNNYDPLVEAKIRLLVRGTNSQGFGASIIDSINNLTQTQSGRDTDKVRAVIALKDSGGGNLEANGQAQAENDAATVIALANSTTPKTMIFTIYYYDGKSESSSTQLILQNMANRTGGKFFRSENSTQLKLDFLEIAEILKKTAGVNASMALDFGRIEQNGTSINGSSVFSYVPVGPFYNLSTTIVPPADVLGRTRIFWPNSSHSVINQSDEWNNSQKLQFNIGTINITERWNATYRLRAINQTGLFNLFNCTTSGSSLSYNDDPVPVCLPDLYIMITNATSPATPIVLDIWNLSVTKSGKITDYVPLEWNFLYTGFSTATETMLYSYNNGPWVQYDSRPGITPGNYTHIGQIDVREFPPGNYRIKVHGVAPDSNDDNETTAFMVSNSGAFIILR